MRNREHIYREHIYGYLGTIAVGLCEEEVIAIFPFLRVCVVNDHQWYSPQTDALDEPK